HFDLDGGPFQWWKFNVAHVNGHLHWKGDRLTLQSINANCYGGTVIGAATFDFVPQQSTDFQFNLAATNALLQLLMADLSTRSNHLEGKISGSLVVNK